jgi:KaiC/GvpD/RAD55 family RecA-like ATPase
MKKPTPNKGLADSQNNAQQNIANPDQELNNPKLNHSITKRLSDIESKQVVWLWKGRIALGKVTLLAGDPGLGKSLITTDMAARISSGTTWPDGSDNNLGEVLIISAEDDPADTIRPRFEAANGDINKAIVIYAVLNNKGDSVKKEFFDLSNGIAALTEILTQRNIKLIIIDPISAFMSTVDSHNNSKVRSALRPLAEIAKKHHTAVLAVSHLNKGGDQPQYRVMGSLAFTAAARSVWIVVKDKNDPQRRLVLPIKNNLAPDTGGLAYSISENRDGLPIVNWEKDPVEVTVEQAFAENSNKEKPKIDETVDWLHALLKEGPMETTEIKNLSKKDSVASWRTIEKAKQRLGVEAYSEGSPAHGGKWKWKLKTADFPYSDPAVLNNPEEKQGDSKPDKITD